MHERPLREVASRREERAPRGAVVAALLRGSWRARPPKPNVRAGALGDVVPSLVACGAAALAWWRLRTDYTLASDPAATLLLAEYRRVAVGALAYERALAAIFARLRAVGLEPILAKGWVAARPYAEPSLRPLGDADLLLPRSDHAKALAILGEIRGPRPTVDLHFRFEELADRSLARLRARSRVVELGSTVARVLGAEDHLGLLCIHLLRHGGWRPLWLCDVAAAIEALPAGFDWDLCLGKKRRRAGWILGAIELARELLGADTSAVPRDRAAPLPRWVAEAILTEWETPFRSSQSPMNHRAPMRAYLRDPRGVIADLRRRWPNPIEAAVGIEGALACAPWMLQVGYSVLRTVRFFTGAPGH